MNDVGGGIKVASVRDPFGNLFGIIENPHYLAMISIEKGTIPTGVWRELVRLGKNDFVDIGPKWNQQSTKRRKKRKQRAALDRSKATSK